MMLRQRFIENPEDHNQITDPEIKNPEGVAHHSAIELETSDQKPENVNQMKDRLKNLKMNLSALLTK